MVMTYNSLVQEVLDYLNRNDDSTINEVPNFIYQAEQRICRESKSIGLETYVTNAFTPGVSVYPKPARWRRSITFNYGNGNNNNVRNQVRLRSYEYLRRYWPDPTQMAAPLFYSDYAYDHFLVAPTPDQAYPFEFGYLELPEPINPNVQTNWLTNNAPDVLLYATLLEAVPFLKNDERIAVWQQRYEQGIQSLNSQDDQRIADRESNRSSD